MNPYEWMTLLDTEGRNPLPPAELPGLFADRHRTGISLDVLAVILSVSWAKGAGPDGWMDRPVPNPWRRSDDVHEDAYRLITDVCREVCDEARAALMSEAAS